MAASAAISNSGAIGLVVYQYMDAWRSCEGFLGLREASCFIMPFRAYRPIGLWNSLGYMMLYYVVLGYSVFARL